MYEDKHASALAKLTQRGVDVTFTSFSQGEYDETTDTWGDPVETSVSGKGVEIPGDPEELVAMELISLSTVTMMFVPTVFGDTPSIGATITWAGVLRTIKQIFPIRPTETLIAARLILV